MGAKRLYIVVVPNNFFLKISGGVNCAVIPLVAGLLSIHVVSGQNRSPLTRDFEKKRGLDLFFNSSKRFFTDGESLNDACCRMCITIKRQLRHAPPHIAHAERINVRNRRYEIFRTDLTVNTSDPYSSLFLPTTKQLAMLCEKKKRELSICKNRARHRLPAVTPPL